MIRYDRNPSLTRLLAGTARWWAVFTVLFFLTFPFWARPLLHALAFVLDGLNGFGAGWR